MRKKIMAALSGGVDSAVAAALLKEQGHEVVGVTMCLGVAPDAGSKVKCCGPGEIEDARRVCQMLEISHYVLDFSRDLEDRVIEPFVGEYVRGRTPNPCVECNRHIKFGILLEKAMAMGFHYVATGHYAALERQNDKFFMKVPRDRSKDQTYFLHAIEKRSLAHILFPLAELMKNEVRAIARKMKLPVSEKRESQDICFISGIGLGAFLAGRLSEEKSGEMIDTDGNHLGRHRGVFRYTIGQRARIAGRPGEPLYVVALDAYGNRVIVGPKRTLFARELIAERINLLVDDLPLKAFAKIRYHHSGAHSRLTFNGDSFRVRFDEPQEAITPGQYVVLYDGGIVLGGGVIREVLR